LKTKKASNGQSKPRKWLIVIAGLALVGLAFAGGGGLYASSLENHDSFCASCHTQPESTYYDRTQVTGSVDLASVHAAKSVNCIDCHSGSGVTGRIMAMTLGAGDLLAYTSGHYNNPALVTAPIKDENCLKCHADISAKRDFKNHFHYFLPQWQNQDPKAATCVECHQAHVTGGRSDLSFLPEAHTVETCKRCHAAVGEGG
jgi:nitrate/TMAO reductase-like tetraheme cytochrome c subunit